VALGAQVGGHKKRATETNGLRIAGGGSARNNYNTWMGERKREGERREKKEERRKEKGERRKKKEERRKKREERRKKERRKKKER
jgi:hypothetical protein